MFYLVGGLWSVFHLVRWSILVWSVVGGRWSVSNVVGGRCFAFLLVGGRFLFLRMVGGRWLMVGGLWSVAGRWFCTMPNGVPDRFFGGGGAELLTCKFLLL